MVILSKESHKTIKYVEKQRFFNGKINKTIKNIKKNGFLEKKKYA